MTAGSRNRPSLIDEVKVRVSCLEYAQAIGVEMRRRGANVYEGSCPRPEHPDRNPSYQVDAALNRFFCRSQCDAKGTVIDQAMHYLGISDPLQAARQIAETLGIDVPEESAGATSRPHLRVVREEPAPKPSGDKPSRPKPRRVRSLGETGRWELRDETGEYIATHVRVEHLLSDGEREKAVYWARGKEKGLGGRPLADLPLYRSHLVAGWPEDALVILTEGEKACDALVAAGIEHAVATVCGSSTCPSLERLEILRGRTIAIWRDDEPGSKHARKLAAALGGIAREVRVYVHPVAGVKGADAADHPAIKAGREPGPSEEGA
jgi:hypothetical protein